MPESKSGALPLGYTPICDFFAGSVRKRTCASDCFSPAVRFSIAHSGVAVKRFLILFQPSREIEMPFFLKTRQEKTGSVLFFCGEILCRLEQPTDQTDEKKPSLFVVRLTVPGGRCSVTLSQLVLCRLRPIPGASDRFRVSAECRSMGRLSRRCFP